MPETHAGYVVMLEDSISAEDAQAIADAIAQVNGVKSVRPIDAEPSLLSARATVDAAWRKRIVGLLDDEGV